MYFSIYVSLKYWLLAFDNTWLGALFLHKNDISADTHAQRAPLWSFLRAIFLISRFIFDCFIYFRRRLF